MIKVEVSLGELVDKVSILAIKQQKIRSDAKLKNIRREYNLLYQSMISAGITDTSDEYNRLLEINLKLWDIEDRIRAMEASGTFDNEFIVLARSVYFTNDDRAAVKREINIRYGSELVEEKEYIDYKNSGL